MRSLNTSRISIRLGLIRDYLKMRYSSSWISHCLEGVKRNYLSNFWFREPRTHWTRWVLWTSRSWRVNIPDTLWRTTPKQKTGIPVNATNLPSWSRAEINTRPRNPRKRILIKFLNLKLKIKTYLCVLCMDLPTIRGIRLYVCNNVFTFSQISGVLEK